MEKEYIERKALITLIEDKQTEGFELCMPEEWKSNYVAGLNKAKQFVEKAPAADVVEVKHGEWINVQDFGGGKCFADCSICRTQEKAPNPTAFKMFRRYCSYCGAKMDLKEGTEE